MFNRSISGWWLSIDSFFPLQLIIRDERDLRWYREGEDQVHLIRPVFVVCRKTTTTADAFNYNISKSDKRRFCKKSSLPLSLSPLVLPNVKYVTLVFHLMNCCIIMSMHLNEWIRARTYMCLHKWENQIDLLLKLAEFMADSKGTIREILLSCRDTLPLPPSSSTI